MTLPGFQSAGSPVTVGVSPSAPTNSELLTAAQHGGSALIAPWSVWGACPSMLLGGNDGLVCLHGCPRTEARSTWHLAGKAEPSFTQGCCPVFVPQPRGSFPPSPCSHLSFVLSVSLAGISVLSDCLSTSVVLTDALCPLNMATEIVQCAKKVLMFDSSQNPSSTLTPSES